MRDSILVVGLDTAQMGSPASVGMIAAAAGWEMERVAETRGPAP